MKQCKYCGQYKPETEFRYSRGRSTLRCKVCRLEYKRELYQRSDRYRKNDNARTEKRRVSLHPSGLTYGRVDELRKKFKLTPESYFALRATQDRRCAICRDPLLDSPRGAHVDHCHNTMAIRGILCVSCNTGLGGFKDDPARLKAAIQYLEGRTDEVIDTSAGGMDLRRTPDNCSLHEE